MLPPPSLRFALGFLLALLLRPALAQTGWQQVYGRPDEQTCTVALRQPDGGFLLIGHVSPAGADYRLALLRTDARGRKQWTRRLPVPGLPRFTVQGACQTDRGELLLDLSAEYFPGAGGHVLVQLGPQSPIRWTRSYAGSASKVADIAPDNTHGGFVVALNEAMTARLLYLNPDGTDRLQVPFAVNVPSSRTIISRLFAYPGGALVSSMWYVVPNPQQQGGSLAVLTDDGVRGAESTLPEAPRVVVPLGGADYVVTGAQAHRIRLGVAGAQWSQRLDTSQGILQGESGVADGLGHVLIYGFSMRNSHFGALQIAQLDAATGQFSHLEASGEPAINLLDVSSRANSAGVFLGDSPGSFIIAGAGQEGAFLSAGSFTELQLGTTAPIQAWPNPVSDADELLVSNTYAAAYPLALYDLSGHQMRSWPPISGGTARLSLQGLPAGIYTLVGTNGQGQISRIRIQKQ
jgi:hypothetical protein